MLRLNNLSGPPRKSRKRIGRGPGSGHGKTATKGHKGQKARSGYSHRPWFQGGQMPLQRRIPKRGFKPYQSTVAEAAQIVNLGALERFEAGAQVTPETLAAVGLIKRAEGPVKILAHGALTRPLTVSAHAFSAAARAGIEASGGQVQLLGGAGE